MGSKKQVKLPTIDNIKTLKVPIFGTDGGSLLAIENELFDIKRVFFVFGVPKGHIERGNHSHKTTEQVLILVGGKATVICDDGDNTISIDLKNIGDAVYIPPLIWDSQIYKTKNAQLMVVSSTKYNNRNDYIDDYDEFLEYRKSFTTFNE